VAKEVKLEPGWLIKDVRKASERLDKWAAAKTLTAHAHSDGNRPGDGGAYGEDRKRARRESR
jgi:hypothetical protein